MGEPLATARLERTTVAHDLRGYAFCVEDEHPEFAELLRKAANLLQTTEGSGSP
jgi:hypothetical protein